MATFDTRIKLKSDTEENWRLIESTFRPLPGELIIYSPDNDHRDYSRVKIGNEQRDALRDLPFIDAGTINGHEVEIVKLPTFDDRPSPGSPDKLYVDIQTNTIYHYDNASGYSKLSNFRLSVSRGSASQVSNWSPGVLTQATIENNTLKITNGQLPDVNIANISVVTDAVQR